MPNGNQGIRIGVGKRLQQIAANDAEDRAIGADPNGDREVRYQCEHRRTSEPPQNREEMLARRSHRILLRPARGRSSQFLTIVTLWPFSHGKGRLAITMTSCEYSRLCSTKIRISKGSPPRGVALS